VLLVPTGVDRDVPLPGKNPYESFPERIAVYIGTIYDDSQRQTNIFWQDRLSSLGRELRKRRIRLCFVGPGRTDLLDRDAVTILGPVVNSHIWDYHYFADVGIALAQGPVQHNESSKIYYYLRAGLPVVSERPVPNNYLIEQAQLGFECEYADDRTMAHAVEAAIHHRWDKEAAIRYVLENHTWEKRAAIYDQLLRRERALSVRW
jgi:glycosyltransferase involved in cell wall biosynthesis